MKHQPGQAALVAVLWIFATVMGTVALIAGMNAGSPHRELTRMQDARAALIGTPLHETAAVALSADIVNRVKQAGILQMNIEPIGTSSASFFVVVNGSVVEDSYSTVHTPELMYRLDFAGDVPRVWVTKSMRQAYEPRTVGYVLEKEVTSFLEARAKQASLKSQWAAKARPA